MKSIAKFFTLCFLAIALLGVSEYVYAEGNCPQGYYPIGSTTQTGPQGCAPMPEYSQEQHAAQSPPLHWQSTWGAIATDADTGSLGGTTGSTSRESAENAALVECRAKGGSKCKIQVTYDNECAAMVVGNKIFNVAADATLTRAIQVATTNCQKDDTNCRVYYSACSLPERIQ